jgi:hypothetical protein
MTFTLMLDSKASRIERRLISDAVSTAAVRPYVVVEWLTMLLRIRKVLRLNLGPETGCPE